MTGDFFFDNYDDSQERKKVKTDQPVGTFFFFFWQIFLRSASLCGAYTV